MDVQKVVKHINLYKMDLKQTLGNRILVKLDGKNDKVGNLYIDTTYDPEKHVMRIGTVEEVPESLSFYRVHQPSPDKAKVHDIRYLSEFRRNNTPVPYTGMDWKTDMEIKKGDKVIMYYLAVQTALDLKLKHYIREFYGDRTEEWVFVQYQEIYALIRDGELIPINGYVLVEPMDNPEEEKVINKAKIKSNIIVISDKKQSNKKAVYGRVAYVGAPIEEYGREDLSDEFVDVKVGDEVVMRKISDIPIEYDMHAKFAGGKKLYRVQRHEILAVINRDNRINYLKSNKDLIIKKPIDIKRNIDEFETPYDGRKTMDEQIKSLNKYSIGLTKDSYTDINWKEGCGATIKKNVNLQ